MPRLQRYSRSLDRDEEAPFQALEARIADYWKLLDPIFHWDAQRKTGPQRCLHASRNFFRGAPPRSKSPTASPGVNEQELNNGDERLKEIFDRFRYRMGLMLAITLGVGVLLALATTRHILRLARDADLRYRQVAAGAGQAEGTLRAPG